MATTLPADRTVLTFFSCTFTCYHPLLGEPKFSLLLQNIEETQVNRVWIILKYYREIRMCVWSSMLYIFQISTNKQLSRSNSATFKEMHIFADIYMKSFFI